MNVPLSAAGSFLSPAAKYGLYNFHRDGERARMRAALQAPAPRIVTLEGLDEENHLLLLEAACHQATRDGTPWECVRLSLEDYNPDTSAPDTFLDDQLARVAARDGTGGKLRDTLSGVGMEMDVSSAFALSVAVRGGLRFAELLEAAAPTFQPVRGYPGPGPERLRALVDVLTARSGLALYIPGSYPLPLTLRRWLVGACRHNERLLLAFAGTGEDDAAEMVPGVQVREHFTLAPLVLDELTEAVDARFGPNEFPPDFYDALLLQSRGVPWRLAEGMKRLMHAGALQGGGGRPWTLADADGSWPALVAQFTSTFHEPVDRLRESDDAREQAMADLVTLGALFRGSIPATVICRHLGVDEEDADALIDDVLARFGPAGQPPLLEEAGVHREIPGERMLRFPNEIGREVLLDAWSREERQSAAAALLATMDDAFPQVTPAIARLFYDLSQHLPAGERHWFREELEWWVGREAAEELKAELVAGLVKGTYTAAMLLRVAYAMQQAWPAYRLAAVLESIEVADAEIAPQDVANYYQARARISLDQAQSEEAERFARAGLESLSGDAPGFRAVLLSVLVWVALVRSDYRLALEYAEAERAAAERWGRLDGIEAQSWSDLGRAYSAVHRKDEAEKALLRALELYEHALAADHPNVSDTCIELAELYDSRDQKEVALAYAERALESYRLHGMETCGLAHACVVGGCLYAEQGNAAMALDHCDEAIRIITRQFGPDDAGNATAYHALGVAHIFLKNPAEAESAFRVARRIRQAVLHPTHSQLAATECGLGRALEDSDPHRAERHFEEALGIYAARRELGTDGVTVLRQLVGLIFRRDVERALSRARSGIAAIEAECGPGGVSSLEHAAKLVAVARAKLDPALHEAFTIHLPEPDGRQDGLEASPHPDAVRHPPSRSFFSWIRGIFSRAED